MERARDGGESAAAPGMKLTGRLRMPKAIPVHLQQHHNQQLLLQQQQQQKLEAQYKSDATKEPTNSSFANQQDGMGDASVVAMLLDSSSAGDAPVQQQQWHRDEHSRFVQALETYGREQSGDEWTKITGFVQTRSVDEVRQHGRQYLQQLVHELSSTGRAVQSIGSLGFTIASLTGEASSQSDSQNDPNGQNHQATVSDAKPLKPARSRAKSGSGSRSNAQSSKSQQLSLASSSSVAAPKIPAAVRKGGRKPKVWTFEEDKIFENALANWGSDKPYSWPKIAAALPGKTAKDARSRYDKLVGDVALIEETDEIGQVEPQAQPRSSGGGLSSRISPPPPIQVPLAADKGVDALMLDFPGSSTRSSRGAFRVSGASMLSPTFLDFLTSEDKPPPPVSGSNSSSAVQGHDLNLTSSMLLPSTEYSRRPPSSSSSSSSLAYARGGRSASPGPVGLQAKSSSLPGARGASRLTPKGFATPRIWQEFLSDDFKLDVKTLAAEDHTTSDFPGGDSTISQDMGNVTLLVSSPERRRTPRAQVDAQHQEDTLQMECDEPMFDMAMQDNEEEDKPEHQQFDRRLVDAIRKRPRAWDAFPEDSGDVEMKVADEEVDTAPHSRSRYSDERGGR